MIAYHGVNDGDLDEVMNTGLIPSRAESYGCRIGHICLSEHPRVAAVFGTVLRVDLTGLRLPQEQFVGGEMRMHCQIDPSRLSVMERPPSPSLVGWIDPATYDEGQHPTCVRLR